MPCLTLEPDTTRGNTTPATTMALGGPDLTSRKLDIQAQGEVEKPRGPKPAVKTSERTHWHSLFRQKQAYRARDLQVGRIDGRTQRPFPRDIGRTNANGRTLQDSCLKVNPCFVKHPDWSWCVCLPTPGTLPSLPQSLRAHGRISDPRLSFTRPFLLHRLLGLSSKRLR